MSPKTRRNFRFAPRQISHVNNLPSTLRPPLAATKFTCSKTGSQDFFVLKQDSIIYTARTFRCKLGSSSACLPWRRKNKIVIHDTLPLTQEPSPGTSTLKSSATKSSSDIASRLKISCIVNLNSRGNDMYARRAFPRVLSVSSRPPNPLCSCGSEVNVALEE